MLIVKNKKRIEYTIKEYKQKVRDVKLIDEIRDRRYYEKPSAKRRRIKQAAKRRNQYGK
jgi:small subunit ribosomal protein S21